MEQVDSLPVKLRAQARRPRNIPSRMREACCETIANRIAGVRDDRYFAGELVRSDGRGCGQGNDDVDFERDQFCCQRWKTTLVVGGEPLFYPVVPTLDVAAFSHPRLEGILVLRLQGVGRIVIAKPTDQPGPRLRLAERRNR